ncbi:MAG: hypothetical protein GC164_12395 [Phycisphaera sp.]|nr:hypothetical protein [Phycisphaera sp.]
MKPSTHQDRLDAATSRRLAKLADRPVDTARLRQTMEQALTEAGGKESPPVIGRIFQRWRTVVAVAAILLFAVWLGVWGLDRATLTPPVMAAPVRLAQLHHDLSLGKLPSLRVTSVEQANKLLADQRAGVLPVPDLPGEIMSCCLYQEDGQTLTCALIEQEGRLISVVVSGGTPRHMPTTQPIEFKGRLYHEHTFDGVRMVMTRHEGRWMCVMGDARTEALLDLAAGIDF